MKCGWCDNESVSEIEIRHGSHKKPPFMVPVCRNHENIRDTQPRFYACGCYYVEGSKKCPVHNNNLTRYSRRRDEDD